MSYTRYALEAQEWVDDALDALTRMEVGNPDYGRALLEYSDAQLALQACRDRWEGRK